MEEAKSRPFEIEAREYTSSFKYIPVKIMCKVAFRAGARLAAQRGAAWVQKYGPNLSHMNLSDPQIRELFLESISNPESHEE